MPVYAEEMTKEELLKLLDEYREKNARLEAELEACNKQLGMAISREDRYMDAIVNLSKALTNMAKEEV